MPLQSFLKYRIYVHMKEVIGERKITSETSEKPFCCKSNFIDHKTIHMGGKPFKRKICSNLLAYFLVLWLAHFATILSAWGISTPPFVSFIVDSDVIGKRNFLIWIIYSGFKLIILSEEDELSTSDYKKDVLNFAIGDLKRGTSWNPMKSFWMKSNYTRFLERMNRATSDFPILPRSQIHLFFVIIY